MTCLFFLGRQKANFVSLGKQNGAIHLWHLLCWKVSEYNATYHKKCLTTPFLILIIDGRQIRWIILFSYYHQSSFLFMYLVSPFQERWTSCRDEMRSNNGHEVTNLATHFHLQYLHIHWYWFHILYWSHNGFWWILNMVHHRLFHFCWFLFLGNKLLVW